MSFIESNDRLYAALTRLYDANTGVTFKNKNGDFKVLIRNDPDGGMGHYMTFETLIVVEDGDDTVTRCLENYVNAVGFESPGDHEFLIDSFEFDKRKRSEEDIEEFRKFLNGLEKTSICQCGERFIDDDKEMCVFCDMTATPEKLTEFECPVCLETGHNFHSVTMKCCGNKTHTLCDAQWYRKGNKTCAFCRAELPKRSGQTQVLNLEELVSSIAGEVERRIRDESENESEDEADEVLSEDNVE